MRRALDAAKSELATLTDRDAILETFFQYTARLFDFAVLFVVKGDVARGRSIHGIASPPELVARLTFPLGPPGILSRARDQRRPFLTGSAMSEADTTLFGSLGRALPSALVVPLVVRDRVVAIVLASDPVAELGAAALNAKRSPMELAREEMLLLSTGVGETLERVILKRKGTGSMPPPAFASPPVNISPVTIASREREPAATPRPAMPIRSIVFGIGFVAASLLLAYGLWRLRPLPDASETVIPGEKLVGWPSNVDPLNVIDAARRTAGLGPQAELASIQAELARGGHVDFGANVKNRDGVFLNFTFVTSDKETEVRVGAFGVQGPRSQARAKCADGDCHPVVPAPKCSFGQVWDAARAAGLQENDRPLVSYAAVRSGGPARPEWSVTVPDRGSVQVDATTCAPTIGTRIRSAAVPLSRIPGAPSEVDPIELLTLARNQSGLESDAVLLQIDARGVGANVRVDLTAPGAGITYLFADPADTSRPRRWREVRVTPDGMPIVTTENDGTPPPSQISSIVPAPPRCNLVLMSRVFRSVLGNTRARLTFTADTVPGPGKWTVEVADIGFRQTLTDATCASWSDTKPDAKKPGK